MSPGSQIAHYRITAKLGQGGMGEVYGATDTRLNRDVAITILAPALVNDPEHLARFEREAQVLASLNHPHIATIHGIEESGGMRALAMELVEGPTLEERIAGGALPLEEALPIALQIATALEAAHEKGVIHRDLKPANVKVTPEGAVKVLDFGLAKTAQTAAANADSSATLTIRSTQAGMILGTAAYMPPEQAAGRPVDKRADIWSFGVVLYEMLSGAQLFQGESVAHTLADVLRAEIDWSRLPPTTPPPIRDLLERCLTRDPKMRLRDIGEARIAIQRVLKGDYKAAAQVATTAQASPPPPRNRWVPWVVTASALSGLTLAALQWTRPKAAPTPLARFYVELPEGTQQSMTSAATMAVPSPDGRYLAFVLQDKNTAKTHLWVRALHSLAAQRLDKTEDAGFPFWSPDSQWIGFFSNQSLRKIRPSGGAPQTICDTADVNINRVGNGATWNSDGVVLFDLKGALLEVPASGGTPAPATTLQAGEIDHVWPQFLPDGKHFLYLAINSEPAKTTIYVQELGSAKRIEVMKNLTRAWFSEPGYLLFVREGSLFAQRFDPGAMLLEGEPVSVAPEIPSNPIGGRSAFASSQTGMLVYRSVAGFENYQLTWFDRGGKRLSTVGDAGEYLAIAMSPDATRVAELGGVKSGSSIWIADLNTGTRTRATFEANPVPREPVWAADSKHLVLPGEGSVEQLEIESGESTKIAAMPGRLTVFDWSADGRFLTLGDSRGETISLLPLQGEPQLQAVLKSPYRKDEFRVSPDGHLVAYTSYESGARDVYVAQFPSFAGRRQVSSSGSRHPVWRKDSRELFFKADNGTLMAIPVRGDAGVGQAQPLFKLRVLERFRSYAVSPDGQRILVNQRVGEDDGRFTVVLNWAAALK